MWPHPDQAIDGDARLTLLEGGSRPVAQIDQPQ